MLRACAAHEQTVAAYRCDSCERLLCEECVETGHRLLFCRHCGERALPLEHDAPADTRELARHQAKTAPYSLQDAFRYPFRGVGGFVFWATFALLAIFLVLESVVMFGGLLLLIPRLLITLLVPGFLFAIVRSTAAGENELPEWPDLFDGERLREFLSALVAAAQTRGRPRADLLPLSGPTATIPADPGRRPRRVP